MNKRRSYGATERKPKRPKPIPKLTETHDSLAENACSEVCSMDRLPNHLMLRIFKLLDLEDLAFVVPRVCKRWSSLATSEDLWSGGHLSYDPYMSVSSKKLFFKCLKMAPKLHALTMEVEWRDGTEMAIKFNSTDCPKEIRCLHFIYDNMPPDVMFTLLRKHKNHLETLTITDTHTPYIDSDVKRVWKDIQNLSKLKHLTIEGAGIFYYKATFKKTAPCWESLKILDLHDCSYEDMNTVSRLLNVIPNLTEVYLATGQIANARAEVKALAKCVNLETVQVPFCKEVKLLEKCQKLDSLIIDSVEETAKEVSSLVTTLSKSTIFPNLKALKMIRGNSDYANLVVALIRGCPSITLLNLVSLEMSKENFLEVLRLCVALEKLYLNEMSTECVDVAITELSSGGIPTLKQFTLVECACDAEAGLCIKLALNKLQELRTSCRIVSEAIDCNCKALAMALATNDQESDESVQTEEHVKGKQNPVCKGEKSPHKREEELVKSDAVSGESENDEEEMEEERKKSAGKCKGNNSVGKKKSPTKDGKVSPKKQMKGKNSSIGDMENQESDATQGSPQVEVAPE